MSAMTNAASRTFCSGNCRASAVIVLDRGQQKQQRLRPAGLAGQVQRQAIGREHQRKGGGEQGGEQPVKPRRRFFGRRGRGWFSSVAGGCMFADSV